MSGYSYSEIQNMQQKAMERVREMKRTSEEVVKTAQRELGTDQTNTTDRNFSMSDRPKVTNMPPNFPQNSQYPSLKEYFDEEQKSDEKKTVKDEKQSKSNTIQNIFNEPDKALLLGLILLLKSEGADESLIMALTYILS